MKGGREKMRESTKEGRKRGGREVGKKEKTEGGREEKESQRRQWRTWNAEGETKLLAIASYSFCWTTGPAVGFVSLSKHSLQQIKSLGGFWASIPQTHV